RLKRSGKTRLILARMPERYRPSQRASTQQSPAARRQSAVARLESRVGRNVLVALLLLPLGSQLLAQEKPKLEASVHGLILMNGFYTSDDMNNSDVPQFALPAGEPARTTTSATVRQSRVTVSAVAQDFADGTLTGELDVDFFGGQQPSTGGRTFPLLRIRRAFAELTGRQWALFVGQESPPIAEVNPSSLAS